MKLKNYFLGTVLLTMGAVMPMAPVIASDDSASELDVIGAATLSVKPDQVQIESRITIEKPTVKEAREIVEKAVMDFYAEIASAGIDKDRVKADDISVYPSYSYKDNTRTLTGYVAERNIVVKLDDFTLIPKVLDIAIKSGMNNVSNVRYGLKDSKTAKDAVRKLAIVDAQEKAKSIADGFGVKIKKVISISYETADYDNHRYMTTMSNRAKGVDANGGDGVYEPSDIKLTDQIRVTYEIN